MFNIHQDQGKTWQLRALLLCFGTAGMFWCQSFVSILSCLISPIHIRCCRIGITCSCNRRRREQRQQERQREAAVIEAATTTAAAGGVAAGETTGVIWEAGATGETLAGLFSGATVRRQVSVQYLVISTEKDGEALLIPWCFFCSSNSESLCNSSCHLYPWITNL